MNCRRRRNFKLKISFSGFERWKPLFRDLKMEEGTRICIVVFRNTEQREKVVSLWYETLLYYLYRFCTQQLLRGVTKFIYEIQSHFIKYYKKGTHIHANDLFKFRNRGED